MVDIGTSFASITSERLVRADKVQARAVGARQGDIMAFRLTQPDNINVLIENTHWAWPQAVEHVLRPRGITALVASSADETLRLITTNPIHLAIIDLDKAAEDAPTFSRQRAGMSGLQVLRTIRSQKRLVPCILVVREATGRILNDALALGAFTVFTKPVDLRLLAESIDRLFAKRYDTDPPGDDQAPLPGVS